MVVDLEMELLRVRMQSVQYESSLLKEVVTLQRMRIEQLDNKLKVEKTLRMERLNLKEYGLCRNCGSRAPYGQIFCARACLHDYARAHRRG